MRSYGTTKVGERLSPDLTTIRKSPYAKYYLILTVALIAITAAGLLTAYLKFGITPAELFSHQITQIVFGTTLGFFYIILPGLYKLYQIKKSTSSNDLSKPAGDATSAASVARERRPQQPPRVISEDGLTEADLSKAGLPSADPLAATAPAPSSEPAAQTSVVPSTPAPDGMRPGESLRQFHQRILDSCIEKDEYLLCCEDRIFVTWSEASEYNHVISINKGQDDKTPAGSHRLDIATFEERIRAKFPTETSDWSMFKISFYMGLSSSLEPSAPPTFAPPPPSPGPGVGPAASAAAPPPAPAPQPTPAPPPVSAAESSERAREKAKDETMSLLYSRTDNIYDAIFAHMRRHGMDENTHFGTYTNIMNAFARNGHLKDLEKFFSDFPTFPVRYNDILEAQYCRDKKDAVLALLKSKILNQPMGALAGEIVVCRPADEIEEIMAFDPRVNAMLLHNGKPLIYHAARTGDSRLITIYRQKYQGSGPIAVGEIDFSPYASAEERTATLEALKGLDYSLKA